MDYSPWVEGGKMVVFESDNISETGEVTPTKIGVNVCYINIYLHDFFELIPIKLNFLMTMDYSPWVEREKLAVFESSGISETGEVTSTKTDVHAWHIHVYLHEFFEPVLIN